MDGNRSAGVWLGAAALSGVLILVTLTRANDLGAGLTLLTIGVAVAAGFGLVSLVRIRRDPNAPPRKRRRAWQPVVACTLGVISVAITWPRQPEPYDPPPAPQQRDSVDFGMKINRHFDHVTTRVLDHTPAVADADVGQTRAPAAVPVVRYTRDASNLTLVVQHNALCEPGAVLLAPSGTGIEVVVVFIRYEKFASDPPEGAESCRVDASDMWSWHSTVGVVLPSGLTSSTVTDVGANGPAVAVTRAGPS